MPLGVWLEKGRKRKSWSIAENHQKVKSDQNGFLDACYCEGFAILVQHVRLFPTNVNTRRPAHPPMSICANLPISRRLDSVDASPSNHVIMAVGIQGNVARKVWVRKIGIDLIRYTAVWLCTASYTAWRRMQERKKERVRNLLDSTQNIMQRKMFRCLMLLCRETV